MYEAEFTHEGDRCTFEVLLERAALDDPALHAIGEVVHDIDLKDGKFGREETAGIAGLIGGIVLAHQDDEQRARTRRRDARRPVSVFPQQEARVSRGWGVRS